MKMKKNILWCVYYNCAMGCCIICANVKRNCKAKKKDVGKRMSALRETLSSEQVLDEFDRVVFESIIEKVLVGGFDEEGNPDPYKLTFVLKGNQSGTVPNAKEHYKAIQKELKKGNKVS